MRLNKSTQFENPSTGAGGRILKQSVGSVEHLDLKAIVTICAAIIAMAHNLDLKVIAEGVETKAQLDYLSAQGCDEVQGFLISKPLPAAALEKRFLSKNRVKAVAEEN